MVSPASRATTDAGPGIRAGWVAVLLAGLFLRCFRLRDQLIADDEWHALHRVAEGSYGDILTRFGVADHSIPLALFFEAMSRWFTLNEAIMHLPAVLAGMLTIALLPLLLRPWTTAPERLLTGALIAIAPLLVHFSRTARPYALVVLLAAVAIVCAYRWWYRREPGCAAAFVLCAALAGWLHLTSLAFTLAPLGWFAIDASRRWSTGKGGADFGRLAGAGLGLAVLCGLLLGPPLLNDVGSLAAKAGQHRPGGDSWLAFWRLFSGSANAAVGVAFGAAAAFGATVLFRREPRFFGFLAFCFLCLGGAVVASGAQWLSHGFVLARYLLPGLPFVLCLTAAGLIDALTRLHRRPVLPTVAGIALLAVLFALGPLPAQHAFPNQFTGHKRFQFDYSDRHNPYALLDETPIPAVYDRLAQTHDPGSVVLVEAPWHFEWHRNVLYRYQQVHGQPVRAGFTWGLCSGPRAGEYEPHLEGVSFRHFLSLSRLMQEPGLADYLILHRERPEGLPGSQWPARIEHCVTAFKRSGAVVWHEDDAAIVFRLSPDPAKRR